MWGDLMSFLGPSVAQWLGNLSVQITVIALNTQVTTYMVLVKKICGKNGILTGPTYAIASVMNVKFAYSYIAFSIQ